MAYNFGASKNNRLTLPASVLTAAEPRPLSIGFRIKQATTTVRSSGISQWMFENTTNSGDPNLGVAIQGGTTNALSLYSNSTYWTSSTWTATTNWHSLGLTWATGSPGAVAFYRDGADITGGTTTASFAGQNAGSTASIGALRATGGSQATDANYTTGFDIDGSLGEFCAWNAVLDAAEMQAFTAGACGLLIRPSALRCCMPFNNGVIQDLYRGAGWVAEGTNTKQADHPRIYWPTGPIIMHGKAGAAAATVSMPPWMIPPPSNLHMLVR